MSTATSTPISDQLLTEAVARHLPRRSAPSAPSLTEAAEEKIRRVLAAAEILFRR